MRLAAGNTNIAALADERYAVKRIEKEEEARRMRGIFEETYKRIPNKLCLCITKMLSIQLIS